jgi:hypothetical protein
VSEAVAEREPLAEQKSATRYHATVLECQRVVRAALALRAPVTRRACACAPPFSHPLLLPADRGPAGSQPARPAPAHRAPLRRAAGAAGRRQRDRGGAPEGTGGVCGAAGAHPVEQLAHRPGAARAAEARQAGAGEPLLQPPRGESAGAWAGRKGAQGARGGSDRRRKPPPATGCTETEAIPRRRRLPCHSKTDH